GQLDAEQAVAADRAKAAHAALLLALGDVGLKRLHVFHRDDVSTLVFTEPPLRSSEIGMRFDFGAKPARERHLGQSDSYSAVGDVVDCGDQPLRDAGANKCAGILLKHEVDMWSGAILAPVQFAQPERLAQMAALVMRRGPGLLTHEVDRLAFGLEADRGHAAVVVEQADPADRGCRKDRTAASGR